MAYSGKGIGVLPSYKRYGKHNPTRPRNLTSLKIHEIQKERRRLRRRRAHK